MIRPRAFLFLWLACLASACTDGSGAMENGRAVPLDLRPSFQVDPVLFPSAAIDRIRLVAIDATTTEQVGSADVQVSPSASQWTLSLGIALGDAPTRDVLVDVELLAGGAVQWSGRLGPITVQAGVSPAQNVGLHRGPLDNLDVVALDVTGAPVWMAVGATAVVVANPTLLAGSTSTPSVYWASTNPAVATVSSEGLMATLTGVSAGTTEIIAAAGTMSVELDLEVRANAPPGFDLEWRGTTTDWHTAANWSTGQVPTATDNVLIPASSVDPTIAVDVTVGSLTVAAGATLTLGDFELIVTGDLAADGLITGTNVVAMMSDGTTVRGSVEAPLQILGGTVAASGPLSTPELMVLGTGVVFDVNGHVVDVSDMLSTSGGGALRMATTGARLNTLYALFTSGGGAGFLTAGELYVRGGLHAVLPDAFAASGSHTVVFEGTQDPLTVELASPGPAAQHFQNVVFDAPGTVSFLSNAVAMGTVDVAQGTVDLIDYELSVGGALSDPSGGLLVAQVRLIGAITALPRTIPGSVVVDATVDWPIDATVAGDVTIDGALDMATHTLSPSGSVYVNGSLEVPVGGAMNVGGGIVLAGGSSFHVDGAVNASGACIDNGALISGTGQHPCGQSSFDRTWIGGDPNGGTAWANAANWRPNGVPSANDVVYIPSTVSQPSLGASQAVGGLLVDSGASVDLSGFTLTVWGDLAVDGTVVNGLVDLNGRGQLHGFFDDLSVSATRSLTGPVYLDGDLTVFDPLTVGPFLLDVLGNLSVESAQGRLIVDDQQSLVSVGGSATFDGASHAGSLTAGVIDVLGDFIALSTYASDSFRSAGTLVYLAGAGDQTVTLSQPGLQAQTFGDLYIVKSGGRVVLQSDVFVAGTLYSTSTTIGRGQQPVTARVFGGLNVYQTTFDGVPLRLETSLQANTHALSGVTFTNMPTNVAQLYLQLEGLGPTVPFVLQSPVFNTVPGQGGYYLEVVNTTQQGLLLQVQVTSPTPAQLPPQIQTVGPVNIAWPYP